MNLESSEAQLTTRLCIDFFGLLLGFHFTLFALEKLSRKKENPEEGLCQVSDKSLANGDSFNCPICQSPDTVCSYSTQFGLALKCSMY